MISSGDISHGLIQELNVATPFPFSHDYGLHSYFKVSVPAAAVKEAETFVQQEAKASSKSPETKDTAFPAPDFIQRRAQSAIVLKASKPCIAEEQYMALSAPTNLTLSNKQLLQLRQEVFTSLTSPRTSSREKNQRRRTVYKDYASPLPNPKQEKPRSVSPILSRKHGAKIAWRSPQGICSTAATSPVTQRKLDSMNIETGIRRKLIRSTSGGKLSDEWETDDETDETAIMLSPTAILQKNMLNLEALSHAKSRSELDKPNVHVLADAAMSRNCNVKEQESIV